VPGDRFAGVWRRPRVKRSLNLAYAYAIHLLHLLLDLSPWFVRNAAWRLLLRECGNGVYVDHHVYFKFPWLVSIGHDVSINRGAEFYCGLKSGSRIRIGSNVRIAPNVRLHAAGHDPHDAQLGDNGADIVIEDGVWIGAGALVLQGACIRRNAVIAAGSVVTGEIPAGMIAAGIPARPIRMRDGHEADRPGPFQKPADPHVAD
jgi:maltose O-acetyltransferase